MMGFSVAALLAFAFSPNPQVAAFLTPCASVARLVGLAPAWVIDTLGNIVVFVPLGALALWLWPSAWPGAWRVMLSAGLGLAVSVTIELAQTLLPTRVPSWRDVALNALGAGIGAVGGVVTTGMRRCRGGPG